MYNKRTLLIDGDVTLYRVCSSAPSETFTFGDDVMVSDNTELLQQRVLDDIQGILDVTGCSDYIFCLSGSRNYRKEHFPEYKTNRVSEKPQGYAALKEWVLATEEIETAQLSNLEGDDIMGMLATQYPRKYAIYSIDKDMKTIPTVLWSFKQLSFYKQSEEAANRFLYTQVLTGDPTDGYKGIPRIGKVKAEVILRDCHTEAEMSAAVLGAYMDYYGYSWVAVDKMQEQLGQARILHCDDYIQLTAHNHTYLGPLEQLAENI